MDELNARKELLRQYTLRGDEVNRVLSIWKNSVFNLFSGNVPEHASWQKTDCISNILMIFRDSPCAYLSFPNGGGINFGNCIPNNDETIYLFEHNVAASHYIKEPFLIKPRKLYFYSPEKDLEWSYFIIDAQDQQESYNEIYEAKSSNPIIAMRQEDYSKKTINGGLFLLISNYSRYKIFNHKQLDKRKEWDLDNTVFHMENYANIDQF